jgi:subtilisin family serine protease
MRRALLGALVAVLLMPQGVDASSAAPVERVTVLVMFEDSVGVAARAPLHVRAGGIVTGTLPEVSVDRVSVPALGVAIYEASPVVRAVEAPRTYRIFGRGSNDPLVGLQWGLRALNAFDAWRLESGRKKDVSVAVLDTGIDATHVDLEGKVEEGFDYTELDEDTYDDEGHGTHVSGIIAANVGNRIGVAGLSPGASIIPMKVCEASGACLGFPILAAAIDSAQRGADVINMSLGGPGQCSEIEQAVFGWVRDQGTLAVAASGNQAQEGNPSIAPANCDNTLGVGAIDQRRHKAEFSSYGDFVDIAAPGVEIWSTYPPLASITSLYIGYASGSGTSMASPFVAAAAALVKARHPNWSPDRIEKKLMATATDVGPRGRDDLFGAGILNLVRALR